MLFTTAAFIAWFAPHGWSFVLLGADGILIGGTVGLLWRASLERDDELRARYKR